jgi:hypothetical protein
VPIFEWGGINVQDVMRISSLAHSAGDVAISRIAKEQFHQGIQPDEDHDARMARSRWLERNGAEYSFPCGVVPQPEATPNEPVLNVLPMKRRAVASVIAAALPSDPVFLLEQESTDVVELGRLPRHAIVDTDVVDEDGSHVPEPLHESFESPGLSLAVLRWSNEGVDEEERFAFRSVWLAWKAARKLAGARREA